MTEQEWLTATDPTPMLEFLRGKTTDRKLRLFAVAACRRIQHLLEDDRSIRAIDVAEWYAEGLVTRKDLEAAAVDAYTASDVTEATAFAADLVDKVNFPSTADIAIATTAAAADALADAAAAAAYGTPIWDTARNRERRLQCALLRDVVGTIPFRIVSFARSWWLQEIIVIALDIYRDCSFERLPALSHALEEAGCDNTDILGHLRGGGDHVRGCWVVDLLLGKE